MQIFPNDYQGFLSNTGGVIIFVRPSNFTMSEFGKRDLDLLLPDTVDGRVYTEKVEASKAAKDSALSFKKKVNPEQKVNIYRKGVKPQWLKIQEEEDNSNLNDKDILTVKDVFVESKLAPSTVVDDRLERLKLRLKENRDDSYHGQRIGKLEINDGDIDDTNKDKNTRRRNMAAEVDSSDDSAAEDEDAIAERRARARAKVSSIPVHFESFKITNNYNFLTIKINNI